MKWENREGGSLRSDKPFSQRRRIELCSRSEGDKSVRHGLLLWDAVVFGAGCSRTA